MKKKISIKDYKVSNDVVVYVNKPERRVTMHVKYGTTDKDWVIMDCIPKKSFTFINMGLEFLCNQYEKLHVYPPIDNPYSWLSEIYRLNSFSSSGYISVYSTACHTDKSEAYMVCYDSKLGRVYKKGEFKEIIAAYQILLVVCAIAPTELLNKRLKEENDEKNKLPIRDRKGTRFHSKSC